MCHALLVCHTVLVSLLLNVCLLCSTCVFLVSELFFTLFRQTSLSYNVSCFGPSHYCNGSAPYRKLLMRLVCCLFSPYVFVFATLSFIFCSMVGVFVFLLLSILMLVGAPYLTMPVTIILITDMTRLGSTSILSSTMCSSSYVCSCCYKPYSSSAPCPCNIRLFVLWASLLETFRCTNLIFAYWAPRQCARWLALFFVT